MHLTKFSDLGLRSLMILGDLGESGANNPHHRRTVSELAVQSGAPVSHMKKVVTRLTSLGVLTAVRGRNGGVYLAQDARNADVGQLLRNLEGNEEVVDCEYPQPCPLAGRSCALRRLLVQAQCNFFATFDGVTVGDLINHTESPRHVMVGIPTFHKKEESNVH